MTWAPRGVLAFAYFYTGEHRQAIELISMRRSAATPTSPLSMGGGERVQPLTLPGHMSGRCPGRREALYVNSQPSSGAPRSGAARPTWARRGSGHANRVLLHNYPTFTVETAFEEFQLDVDRLTNAHYR